MRETTPFVLTDLKELSVLTPQSHFAGTKHSFVLKLLLLTIELTQHALKLSWYFLFQKYRQKMAQNSHLY